MLLALAFQGARIMAGADNNPGASGSLGADNHPGTSGSLGADNNPGAIGSLGVNNNLGASLMAGANQPLFTAYPGNPRDNLRMLEIRANMDAFATPPIPERALCGSNTVALWRRRSK
jgi:hypothetical protein